MAQAKKKRSRASPGSRRSRKKKRSRRRSNQHALSRAIVKSQIVTPTVIAHGQRERELTQAEVDLVHRTVAKGTTPDQFALFLWHCRKHGFDPVAKEVYCVLFNVTKHHQDFECSGPPNCLEPQGNTGIWHKGKDMVIITGIGGLRGSAARGHDDYGSTDEPVYTFGNKRTPAGKLIPETCTVSVWKKGATRPTTSTLYWEEFAPSNLEDPRFEFWNKKPKNQIAKCTEAQSLRKAYPDLANIYVKEEFAQKFGETTPEGREMTVTHRLPQAVADARAALRDAKSPEEAKKAQEAFNKARAIGQQRPSTAPADAPAAAEGKTLMGTIVVNKDFTVTGDLQDVSPVLQKLLLIQWGNDSFWHIQPKDIPVLAEFCREHRYGLVVPGSQAPAGAGTAQAPARSRPSQGTGPSPPAGRSTKRAGTGEVPASVLVTGVIDRVTREPRGNKVLGIVTLIVDKKHPVYSSWDKDVTDILAANLGQLAEVWTMVKGTYRNIIGVQKVGAITYTDGKIPDVQLNREPGKTLF